MEETMEIGDGRFIIRVVNENGSIHLKQKQIGGGDDIDWIHIPNGDVIEFISAIMRVYSPLAEDSIPEE